MFLDTTVYKGTRFKDQSILDVKTHFKPTKTFQYTHFTSCHPPSVKNGFVKGEALRILRTNSSKDTFEENISKFKRHLRDRGYPRNLVEKLLSEIKFTRRGSVLKGNGSCVLKASVDRVSVDTLGRYVDRQSADMSTDSRPICRPILGRYVGRDSVDISADCRSTRMSGDTLRYFTATRPTLGQHYAHLVSSCY